MYLSFCAVEQKRRILTARCGQVALLAVAVHLTLPCLSFGQSVAFHCSSSKIYFSRQLSSSLRYGCLPEWQRCDSNWSVSSPLIISQRKHLQIYLHMSTKDDDIKAEQLDTIGTASLNTSITSPASCDTSKSTGARIYLSRTLLLAIPLMMKFGLVLIIKFLTDLVVFPLLLTYRAARLSKRRVVKIWKHWTSWTSKTKDSRNSTEVNMEVYEPNGSVPSTGNSIAS